MPIPSPPSYSPRRKGKILSLQFGENVPASGLSKWKVLETDGLTAKIELSGAAQEQSRAIARLMEALPIKDIELKNPDIESVVKELYGSKA